MASWLFWFHYLLFQLLELHHGGKATTLHLRPFRILFIKHRYDQKAACQNLAMECPSRKTSWDRKKRQAPYKLKFQHETASPNLPRGVWNWSQLPPLPKHHLQDASPKALSGMHLWVAGFAGTKSLVWRSLVFFSQVYIWLYLFPSPKEQHVRSNVSSHLFKMLTWRRPRLGIISPCNTETQVWM